jgi:ribokinase
MGEKGALIYSSGKHEMYPPPRVKVVDTTAAGDAFTAAMAVKYVKHRDITKAVKTANIAGALTVTRLGAQPSLPTRDEVEAFARNWNS